MNYFKHHISTIRHPAVLGADCTTVGVWFRFINYCAEQENDGIMEGALAWSDMELRVATGVTLEELHHALRHGKLVRRSGQDVAVELYPIGDAQALDSMRKGGKKGGRAKLSTSENNPPAKGLNPPAKGLNPSDLEEKRREEKRIYNTISPDGDREVQNSSSSEPDAFDDEKVRAAARIVNRYPRSGGDPMRAQLALIDSLRAGATEEEVLAGVDAHAAAWRKLSVGRQQLCPGRQRYFEAEEWRHPATASPWIDPDASTPAEASPKKIKGAAQLANEERKLAVARDMFPEMPAGMPWDALSTTIQLAVEAEDRKRQQALRGEEAA